MQRESGSVRKKKIWKIKNDKKIHYNLRILFWFSLFCKSYPFCKLRHLRRTLFFTFFYLRNESKNIVFGPNFWNGNFDGFARYKVPWIQKSHFQRLVSVCVYYQHNSKKITTETSNLVLYICITYRCYLNIFYKDRTKTLCTQAHKRILIH